VPACKIPAMRPSFRPRRIVAILAAYALALQTLLSASAGALHRAADLDTSICSGAGSAGNVPSLPPSGHDLNCPACAASSSPIPVSEHWDTRVTFAVNVDSGAVAPRREVTELARARPQSPRAPPVVV